MLEFISPLALNHSQNLLAAASHVWNDRQKSLSVAAKTVSQPFVIGLCNAHLLNVCDMI